MFVYFLEYVISLLPRSQNPVIATRCNIIVGIDIRNAFPSPQGNVTNIAISNIIIGGQVVYFSFQFANIAIPNTISDNISTQAKNIGIGKPNPSNIAVTPEGFATNSLTRPGRSISNPKIILLTNFTHILFFYFLLSLFYSLSKVKRIIPSIEHTRRIHPKNTRTCCGIHAVDRPLLASTAPNIINARKNEKLRTIFVM